MYRIIYLIIIPVFLGISTVLSSCDKKEGEEDSKLLFIDDFSGSTSIPDNSVWELCKYGNNAWGQHFKHVEGYENVKIEDGILKLKASKENGIYKNGGVRTKIGFPSNTRLEVRARLTKLVKGGFPAIWQMPMNAPQWPKVVR